MGPQSFMSARTGDTRQVASEEWSDSSHIHTRFVAMLTCDNTLCGESAAVAGTGLVEEFDYEDEHGYRQCHAEVFFPKYFSPSPALINVPKKCPRNVAAELAAAFVSSWGDFNAAGNCIRSAVELLLDELQVPRKGKLHHRLEGMKDSHPTVQEHLLAIKWIGNAGSHGDALTRSDIFDALDIFEHVLELLYVDHVANLRRVIASVNENQGPYRS